LALPFDRHGPKCAPETTKSVSPRQPGATPRALPLEPHERDVALAGADQRIEVRVAPMPARLALSALCKRSASIWRVSAPVAAPARSLPGRFDCPKSVIRGRGTGHEYLPAASAPGNLPAPITIYVGRQTSLNLTAWLIVLMAPPYGGVVPQ
jgi:hypothetical protein